MKISDLISMCLQNLSRRKIRTVLTTMGVVIGTCSIVVMISLGVGLQKSQEAMLAEMGDLTKIEIYNYNGGGSDQEKLNDAVLEQISGYDHVEVVTPVVQAEWGKIEIRSDDYVFQDSIYGMYPEALEKLGYTLKEGSFPTGQETEYTILFGEFGPYSFYDPENWEYVDPYAGDDPNVDVFSDEITLSVCIQDPESNSAQPEQHEATVSGVLVGDWNVGYETMYGAFLSVDQLYELYQEYDDINGISSSSSMAFDPKNINYDRAYVKVDDINNVAAVEDQIQALGYDTYSMESMRESMQEQTNTIMLILGSLGGISLLVAAMGITNTMIMSIYERTREIGIMKVLGCVVADIRTVFLMEAGLIGLGGGVIGVAVSYLISLGLNYLVGGGALGISSGSQLSVIPLWLVGLALVFSTLIGLISGFSPANRAVKISALSAIKQE
ncbi:MAG: ABC transporter permease [Oscillospiraceae bacterium]|nr:ABC transporter permease [Oscillospiraceae bacterium]